MSTLDFLWWVGVVAPWAGCVLQLILVMVSVRMRRRVLGEINTAGDEALAHAVEAGREAAASHITLHLALGMHAGIMQERARWTEGVHATRH